MSDFNLPEPPDDAEYWGFTPYKETLYGADCVPRRFLRIIDAIPGGASRVFHTYQDDPEDPLSLVKVETVDVDSFAEYITYGYTPYIEAALCGLKSGVGLEEHKGAFLSQAAYRNYEQRARCLMEIMDEKRYSVTSFTGSDSSVAVREELAGVLSMWEMLMNTGSMTPLNCLSYCSAEAMTKRHMRDKLSELEERCLMSNFAPLPFTISDTARKKVIEAFH